MLSEAQVIESLGAALKRTVGHALSAYCAGLQAHGSSAEFAGKMLDFDGLNRLLGSPEL